MSPVGFLEFSLDYLNRPEYITAPEAFLTSLAWRCFDGPALDPPPTRKLALAYTTTAARTSKTLETIETMPTSTQMRAWSQSLNAQGIRSETDQVQMAEALSGAIRGTRATRAKSQSALPLTPRLALLQNLRGLLVKANPPDLGSILEAMFALGTPTSDGEAKSVSAAGLWLQAANRRVEGDPLLRALDVAARQLLPGPVTSVAPAAPDKNLAGSYLPRSPYSWFYEMWTKITSDEWVDALPPRVWTDWATTVLRLGFGVGYLWEAAWFETVARSVLRGTEVTEATLLQQVPEALPWKPATSQVSVRDVAASLTRRIGRGYLVRARLARWRKSHEIPSGDNIFEHMRQDVDLIDGFTSDLSSEERAAKNTWEAIRYSLLVRDSAGPDADHYGLLRSVGRRWLVIEPANEWIAVVASLTAPSPGAPTTVGKVQHSLHDLGLRPQPRDLVALLARAGMARGSPDADQAVVVQAAYGVHS